MIRILAGIRLVIVKDVSLLTIRFCGFRYKYEWGRIVAQKSFDMSGVC